MTYCNSCLVQALTWIITWFSLFLFLSVVKRCAAWGRQELHHCLRSPCLDYTKAVCGPDPRWDQSWNYCHQCEQHRSHLPVFGQVPHHYLADLLPRIPRVWAVKKKAHNPCCLVDTFICRTVSMALMQLSEFGLNVWLHPQWSALFGGFSLFFSSHGFEIPLCTFNSLLSFFFFLSKCETKLRFHPVQTMCVIYKSLVVFQTKQLPWSLTMNTNTDQSLWEDFGFVKAC